MARVAGVDLPKNKRLDIALRYIYGIGPVLSNAIIKELNGEKIDVVAYNKSQEEFIANALSPAKNLRVYIIDEKNKEALVVVDDENLSLAIGKKGLNVRLASRLTHYKLDVKTVEQVKESGINILE